MDRNLSRTALYQVNSRCSKDLKYCQNEGRREERGEGQRKGERGKEGREAGTEDERKKKKIDAVLGFLLL